MKQHVENLEELFGGRAGICAALGVQKSVVSNWTKRGIPADRKHTIICLLAKEKKKIPEWLLELKEMESA